MKKRRGKIESWDFTEVIGWIRYDRDECIGCERTETLLAYIGSIIGRTGGADIDIFDVLAILPWNKSERPLYSDDVLIDQIRAGGGGYNMKVNK